MSSGPANWPQSLYIYVEIYFCRSEVFWVVFLNMIFTLRTKSLLATIKPFKTSMVLFNNVFDFPDVNFLPHNSASPSSQVQDIPEKDWFASIFTHNGQTLRSWQFPAIHRPSSSWTWCIHAFCCRPHGFQHSVKCANIMLEYVCSVSDPHLIPAYSSFSTENPARGVLRINSPRI